MPHVYAQETTGDSLNLLDLGLEELMQVQIISAPGFSCDPKSIPSAVTVISAADIRLYGWQTLGLTYTTSLTHQHTFDQETLVQENVPAYLLKMNLAFPTPVVGLGSAVEFRAASHRHTFLQNTDIAGYGITNLIFNYQMPDKAWSMRSGIKDIFDRGYEDPVGEDPLMEIPRDRIPRLGRTWFAELAYKY